MKMVRAVRRTVAALAVAALVALPSQAAARVTVTVQVAYGGVVVGGVGFFLYFAGSWESYLALRDVPTALVEIREGRARLGLPLPLPSPDQDFPDQPDLTIDLLRWRF